MKELRKKCIVIYKDNVISIKEINFTGRCYPGNGFEFAEFDTVEELDAFIKDKELIEVSEADYGF